MRTRDPDGEHAAAYVSGELTGEDRRDFENRLAADPSLRRRVAALQKIVDTLKADPPSSVRRDLAPDVLGRLDRGTPARQLAAVRPPKVLKIAAAVLLVLGGAFALMRLSRRSEEPFLPPSPATGPAGSRLAAIDGALNWLVRTQEGDGSWDPGRWEGQETFRVGLTGMGILAFVRHDPAPRLRPRRRALDRAVDYLLSRQGANGCVGDDIGGMLCNHGIATIALIEVYAARGRDTLPEPIGAAIRYSAEQQLPCGGWGQQRAGGTASTEVSVWQLYALDLAQRTGIPLERQVLDRGVRWLTRSVGLTGRPDSGGTAGGGAGGATLTAMNAFCVFSLSQRAPGLARLEDAVRGALSESLPEISEATDFYRWFFTAAAVRAGECRELEPWLAELQRSVVGRRNQSGRHAGSWNPEGRLSGVGGRLYTTVLAALLLESVPAARSG